MSKKKQARREAAGAPFNPMAQQISYGMSPVPGAPPGPGNMNGNPENVMGLGQQVPSMNGGMQENLYRDQAGLMYPQMGSEILNPMQVQRSPIQQNTPIGQRLNSGASFGMQPQPPAPMMDQMEAARYTEEVMKRGLINPEFEMPSPMGMIGRPAVAGSMPSDMNAQTNSVMPLTPMPVPGMGGMTPDNMMQQQMGPQPTQTGATMNMTPNPGPGPGGMTPDNMMAMAPDDGAKVPGKDKKVIRGRGRK